MASASRTASRKCSDFSAPVLYATAELQQRTESSRVLSRSGWSCHLLHDSIRPGHCADPRGRELTPVLCIQQGMQGHADRRLLQPCTRLRARGLARQGVRKSVHNTACGASFAVCGISISMRNRCLRADACRLPCEARGYSFFTHGDKVKRRPQRPTPGGWPVSALIICTVQASAPTRAQRNHSVCKAKGCSSSCHKDSIRGHATTR